MELIYSQNVWLVALGIFFLRICNISIDTIRFLVLMRGRKTLTWVLGFVQSIIFLIAISSVLANLDNLLNIIAYSAGYATGNIVGMWIEGRLAIGHLRVSIVSSFRGAAVADKLRVNGFAVTEISGRGLKGTVSVMECDVLRKDLDNVETIVLETDPEAFVTAEDVRPIRSGFWRGK